MKLEWVGLAEASVEDGRGAVTLVGLNLNVFAPKALPAGTKRTVVIIARDEDGDLIPGSTLEVRLRVDSPSEQGTLAFSQNLTVGDRKYENVPGGLTIQADLGVDVKEYGPYTIRVGLESGGVTLAEGEKILYVVEPPSSQ